MKMFKKKDGFTLVELIVVIAILAILAGVAIPAYSGYLEKANDASVVTELDAIQTAVQGANAAAGEIKQITINADGKTITVTAKDSEKLSKTFDDDVEMFYTAADCKTDTSAGTSDTATIELSAAINNWAKSSYGKGTTKGAVWTRENGWKVGTTP